jgi:hypothetical protein
MPSTSLLKFTNRIGAGDKKLWWARAGVDGVPFRGSQPPIMLEEEYEARTVRIADARNAFFDVYDIKENKQYLDVIECALNGWFRIVHLERFWRGTTSHYVEWIEYYMEDGTRVPFSNGSNIMEMASGQPNLFGNPQAGAGGAE